MDFLKSTKGGTLWVGRVYYVILNYFKIFTYKLKLLKGSILKIIINL